MPAPVIAVMNMKGGVGKTTVSASLARALFRNENRTLMIDFDPQFNLTQLMVAPLQYQALLEAEQTVMAVMERVPAGKFLDIRPTKTAPPAPDKVTTMLRYLKQKHDIELRLLPGAFRLHKYSIGGQRGELLQIQQRFLSFVHHAQSDFDLIVIDCNPSSSFLTQCALMAASHVLVPVREDAYSKLGIQLLDEFINSLPRPHSPKLNILINAASRSSSPSVLEQEIRQDDRFGNDVLANRLYYSGYLKAKPDFIGDVHDRSGPYHAQAVANVKAVAQEYGKLIKVKV